MNLSIREAYIPTNELKKYTPEYVRKHGKTFTPDIWYSLAMKDLIPEDVVDKYGASFNDNIWKNLFSHDKVDYDLITKYFSSFGPLTWAFLVKQNPDNIGEFASIFTGPTWAHLIKEGLISKEMLDKYSSTFEQPTWKALAENNLISEELMLKNLSKMDRSVVAEAIKTNPAILKNDNYIDKFDSRMWAFLVRALPNELFTEDLVSKIAPKLLSSEWVTFANSDLVSEKLIDEYADKDIFDDEFWIVLSSKHPNLIPKYANRFSNYVWRILSRPNHITSEMALKYGDKFDQDMWWELSSQGVITEEIAVKYGKEFHDNAWEILLSAHRDWIPKFVNFYGGETWLHLISNNLISEEILIQNSSKFDYRIWRELRGYLENYSPKFRKFVMEHGYQRQPLRQEMYFDKIRKEEESTSTVREEATQFYHNLLTWQELVYKYQRVNAEIKANVRGRYMERVLQRYKDNLKKVNISLIDFMYQVIRWVWYEMRKEQYERRKIEMDKNIKLMKDLTDAKNSDDVEFQIQVINWALNAIHSSGDMIEHYNLSRDKFDYLSNMDTTEWDNELKELFQTISKLFGWFRISFRENVKKYKFSSRG